jgi:hypothetical protein
MNLFRVEDNRFMNRAPEPGRASLPCAETNTFPEAEPRTRFRSGYERQEEEPTPVQRIITAA